MRVPFTRNIHLMRFGWTIYLIFFFNLLAAQMPAYLHYTVQDGLPSNLVYCGLQDRRGLLWFGTDKGLACFDGSRFRIYSMADGLPDPEIPGMAGGRRPVGAAGCAGSVSRERT